MICGKDLIIKFLDETSDVRERIAITCLDPDAPDFSRSNQVGRDSIDLRIGKEGYKIKCNYTFINTLAPNIDQYFEDIDIPKSGYILYPGETIIVSTVEKVKLTGNIMGELMGRTRFARMGLSVCTASKFQSYSDAVIVLQVSNHNRVPLKIFPYQKLVQMIIHQVDGIPNARRGNYSDETRLKRPIINDDELFGMSGENSKLIERQIPAEIPYMDVDGNKDDKRRITDNNKRMNFFSKMFSAISAILGLLIGIFCSGESFDTTTIIIMAIASVLLTVMSVILDTIKDNNFIE